MSTRSKAEAEAALPSEPILRLDPGMHAAPIKRIDVDAAGRFLVTGSDDKTARVWSLEDGRLLRTLRVPIGEGDVGKVYAVAISPDGAQVAAGGWGPGEQRPHSIYIFERATGRLAQRVDGLPNVVHHLAFSPDGRRLVATLGRDNGIRVFETGAFRQIAEDRDYGGDSYWAAFDPAGRLVTTSYDCRIRLYDLSELEDRPSGEPETTPTLTLPHRGGGDKLVAGPGVIPSPPAGESLPSGKDPRGRVGGTTHRIRPARSVEAPGGARPYGVALSPDRGRIAVGYGDSTRVDVLDGATLEPLFEADTSGVDNGDMSKVTWSADGRFLHAGGRWGQAGKLLLRRWADGGTGAHEDIPLSDNTIMDLRPLPDGRLAFGAGDPTFGLLAPDGSIPWRRDSVQADFRGRHNVVAVARDAKSVRFGFWLEPDAQFDIVSRRLSLDPEPDPALATARTEAAGLIVEGWEDTTTPTLNGKPLALDRFEPSRSLAIAPDGQRFLLGTEWSLRLFDRAGKQLWEKSVPGAAWAVNITGDGRLAVAEFDDGTIRWFRLEDGEELLVFFPHRDRERWVVWTPEGYYMASPGAEDLIGWHLNRGLDEAPEWYSAGRFRDRFHRPDVVALVLDELDVEKALARANRETGVEISVPLATFPADLAQNLPPVIQILEPASGTRVERDPVTIKYLVWTPGGEPVPSVRVMVDGALAMIWNEPDPAMPPDGRAGELYVPVIARASGGKAIVRLIAENAHGASDPATIGLQLAAAAAARAAAAPQPRLFMLAVGVARYKHTPPDDLTYAARDAEDVANLFLRQKGLLYRDVELQVLRDDDATREGVTDAIGWLLDHVDTDDVVMIFFSGHGVVERDVYYFLPHEANSQTQTKLRISAIDDHTLMDCFKTLFDKGAKVYAFFDTCYAGALGPGVKAPPTDLDRFASKLASEENGVVVFTSCTGGQRSHERDEWQNGAFTEALLEALAGQAARAGERAILLSDVKRYLRDRVPALTGGAQTPKIYIPFEEDIDPPIAVLH
jgi:WD40 repeat protein